MMFGKYIKGLYQTDSQGSLYSGINFAADHSGDLQDASSLPSLKVCRTQDGTQIDCGYFLTQKALNQSFNNLVGFNGGSYQDIIRDASTDKNIYLERIYDSINSRHKLYFGCASSELSHLYQIIIGGHDSADNGLRNTGVVGKALFIGTLTERTDARRVSGYLTAKNILATDAISTNGAVTAQYFNATSDKRAKTDIQPLLINALELVRKTKLYSFKYKETDTPSIGIIAQDVQDININGFKLVDNEEATGRDLDYMTIHESKLTYILGKAVQEQQKEIENLKQQLDELKKN